MFTSPIMQLLLGSLSTTLVLSGSLKASVNLKMEQSALIELVTTMQSEIGFMKSELKETKAQLNLTTTELTGAKKELTVTKSALTESRNVLAQILIKVYQSIYNADPGFYDKKLLIHFSAVYHIACIPFGAIHFLMYIHCIGFHNGVD